MYDELISALRQVSEDWGARDFAEEPSYVRAIIKEAADAIEELSKDRDNWKATAKEEREAYWHWFDQYQKDVPRWIPVTERLPEQKKAHYLCLLDDDSMAVVYWSKVPDWVSKGEWAWHNPNWKDVTHWMPLPEPPKEE